VTFCVRCGLEHDDPCWVPFRCDAFWSGAAALGGLMGMAEAIRYRMGYRSTMWHAPVPARPITFDDDADVDYEPFI
jgi:hypothetical protein